MRGNFFKEPYGVLNTIDRVSEIMFGLIMAVTIVGSLSIATAGTNEVRTVMSAALGCNLAWGLVDAVMYLVRTLTERTRNIALAKQVIGADSDTAHRLIMAELPGAVATITGPDEVEGMRRRLLDLGLVVPGDQEHRVTRRQQDPGQQRDPPLRDLLHKHRRRDPVAIFDQRLARK